MKLAATTITKQNKKKLEKRRRKKAAGRGKPPFPPFYLEQDELISGLWGVLEQVPLPRGPRRRRKETDYGEDVFANQWGEESANPEMVSGVCLSHSPISLLPLHPSALQQR